MALLRARSCAHASIAAAPRRGRALRAHRAAPRCGGGGGSGGAAQELPPTLQRALRCRYIYLHELGADPDYNTTATLLTTVLRGSGRELELECPLLTGMSITEQLEALEAHVAEVDAAEPPAMLRLIGSGVGAYVAALYASRHTDRVDSLFLLSPAFKPSTALRALAGGEAGLAVWEGSGKHALSGVPIPAEVPFSWYEEARSLPPHPFVTCEAYTIFGMKDDVASYDEALAFNREGSEEMRTLANKDAGPCNERKMLEVNDGHGLELAITSEQRMVEIKLLEFFDLLLADDLQT